MATIKMVDSQNAVLTKTEISEKLFWVSIWNFHHLLMKGYCMQKTKKNLSSPLKMTDFQNGIFEA